MKLVVVDTTGIQPYIFASNRLRENIGASHLVAMATESWAFETLTRVAPCSNIMGKTGLDASKRIEDSESGIDAEVLYAGGGNFVAIFKDGTHAAKFERSLSIKVLTEAPGLQIVIVAEEYDWGENLFEKVSHAFHSLAESKRSMPVSSPLLGLGVTVMCQSTGLPAIGKTMDYEGEEGYPASAEILTKIDAVEEAEHRLKSYVHIPDGYVYPREFDDLGRSRDTNSYIAVVHADGDDMGKRMQQIGKEHSNDNREYIKAIRGFSDAVEESAKTALKGALDQVVGRIEGGVLNHPNRDHDEKSIPLKEYRDGTYKLPFRPLVFGGDDVTFVCDGRIGLPIALTYSELFEKETAKRPECGGAITASAGVSIVKSHYPFARAYTLAENLIHSAKIYRKSTGTASGCIDWHWALSGLFGSIDDIRRREYCTNSGSLTLRPVTIDGTRASVSHRAWDVIIKGIKAFQGSEWNQRHNKVKALRDALRDGPEAVGYFNSKFNNGQNLPKVHDTLADFAATGWYDKTCGYFDALEMADWFIPLDGSIEDKYAITSSSEK